MISFTRSMGLARFKAIVNIKQSSPLLITLQNPPDFIKGNTYRQYPSWGPKMLKHKVYPN